MDNLRKKLLLLAVVACSCMAASAQDFLWKVDFDFRFDNREYTGMEFGRSKTIFGTRFSPEIGLGWGTLHYRGRPHKLMAGVELTADFGTSKIDSYEPILYYNYTSPRVFDLYAGSFPRSALKGDYSTAFFSDEVKFYHKLIQGYYMRYGGDGPSYVEMAIDWNSKLMGRSREKFMMISSGRFDFDRLNLRTRPFLYAGYDFMMYHYAASEVVSGVMDNILIYPHVGLEWTFYREGYPIIIGRYNPNFPELSLKAGWLFSMQRDRNGEGGFVNGGGFQCEAKFRWKGFGLSETLYLGGDIMTYYDAADPSGVQYGDGLYFGDTFYRTNTGIYNRLELFWERYIGSGVNLKVSSVHHYDGAKWGWQQVLTIGVRLDSKLFGR